MWSQIAAIIAITGYVLFAIHTYSSQINNPTYEYFLAKDIGDRQRVAGRAIFLILIFWLGLMIWTGYNVVNGKKILDIGDIIAISIGIGLVRLVRWYTKKYNQDGFIVVLLLVIIVPVLVCLIAVIILANTPFG